MARPYVINILDGEGTSNVVSGSYEVTSVVNGYDNNTIDPNSIVIDKTTNTYSFTVGATGTLTLHVTDTGLVDGNPIIGASFIRCDNLENEYGESIITDSTGNAVFNNVPYADSSSPIIYFKQLTSDGDHEFNSELQQITMTDSSLTFEIENSTPLLRTISLTDSNYTGLPITGQLTLS